MKSENQNALDLNKFPEAYREYFSLEAEFVNQIVNGYVLDIGCGTGRIVPAIPEVARYLGIDIDQESINEARAVNLRNNAQFYKIGIDELTTTFPENSFDTSLILWNTLPIVGLRKLEEIAKLTKDEVIVTLAARNDVSLKERKQYYESLGIDYFLEEDHTITSDVWGRSPAYFLTQLEKIAIMNN